ncbi:NUDIX domain-containing protein [Nesterenkonia sp. CL21]|uniref:NUDIX hydrolase n=1 Tax=Nesterenkonia sp. CL21 TaxID=3064894 RepID=UPI00287AFF50|nr:NUDIX domain-containing protein [Nesterenkonia sp. CL21]MDS2172622.1 NUDIX domain-containing protein [Nesterenkonia sp. CL21]
MTSPAGSQSTARAPAPHQHLELAVSTVVFSLRPGPAQDRPTLWLPLVRRIRDPFCGRWALPGGPLEDHHDLAASARETLKATTGLEPRHLEQLYAFGDVDRSGQTDQRVVSIVYWALVRPEEDAEADHGDNVAWFPADETLRRHEDGTAPLAFDHGVILRYALQRLRAKITYSPIAHAFLPEEFPLTRLREVYEAILGRDLDPSNFRRQVLAQGSVESTGRRMTGTNHRPPLLYRSAPNRSRYTLTIEENP